MPGIDIKADGGYIVAAPSIVDGVHYEFLNVGAELASAPAWLVELIKHPPVKSRQKSARIREGQRNNEMFHGALTSKRSGTPMDQAIETALEVNMTQCQPPLEEGEVIKAVHSAYRYDVNDVPPEIMELNQNHAVVKFGGKCRVLCEIEDTEHGNLKVEFYSSKDFKEFYANRYVTVDQKQRPLGAYWFGHPHRRQYVDVGFYPKGAPAGHYNLWTGFAVEPKEGDCSLYLEHIRENIANGDVSAYEYIIAWMADVVQNPDNLVGTALVLRGQMGVGKGVFANQFGALFGKHYMSLNQSNQLVGRFNGHFKNAVLLHADEAFWGGDKQAEGTLKSLVTEPYITIEEKGINAFTMKNYLHMIFSTNNDWAVPAGTRERRFCVLDVGEKRMQDSAYFGAIAEQMNNGGREALLHFLLSYDLTDVDLRKFPQTEALWEQKLKSMTLVQKFWLQRLMTGQLDEIITGEDVRVDSDWGDGSIPVDRLYHLYQHFAGCVGSRHKGSKEELGVELRKLIPAGELRKSRKQYHRDRVYYYEFPDLNVCREHFEKLVNYKIVWPVEPVEKEE